MYHVSSCRFLFLFFSSYLYAASFSLFIIIHRFSFVFSQFVLFVLFEKVLKMFVSTSIFDLLLKFTLVVDNDTTLNGAQTDTVAFSPTALIKCSICSYPQSLTRTPPEWLKKSLHDSWSQIIILVAYRTVSVTLAGLSLVARRWTVVLRSATGASLVGSEETLTVAGNTVGCRVCVVSSWEKRRRRIAVSLSVEEHDKHCFRIWCGFCLRSP